MIFRNMQMQKVLIREILSAFLTPVHVRLLIMNLVFLKTLECEWLVRGQQALHDGGVV